MIKILGGASLIAGTTIGAGMLALPISLAKIGLIPSILLMITFLFVSYYSSIIIIELNMRSSSEKSYYELVEFYGGKTIKKIYDYLVFIFVYCLLSAYINACSSSFETILKDYFAINAKFNLIAIIFVFSISFVLSLSMSYVVKLNKFLLIILLTTISYLVVNLIFKVDFLSFPLFEIGCKRPECIFSASTILVTAFTYQLILPTIIKYFNKNLVDIKKSVIYASILVLILYLSWFFAGVGVIQTNNPEFYYKLVNYQVMVGEFSQNLAQASGIEYFSLLIWIATIFSVLPPSLGISITLLDLSENVLNKKVLSCISSFGMMIKILVLLLIPLTITIFFPQIFIKALNLGGVIVLFSLILLPIYLLHKSDKEYFLENQNAENYNKILDYKIFRYIIIILSSSIIFYELASIIIG